MVCALQLVNESCCRAAYCLINPQAAVDTRQPVLTALEHQEGSVSVSKGWTQFYLYLKEFSPQTFVLTFKNLYCSFALNNTYLLKIKIALWNKQKGWGNRPCLEWNKINSFDIDFCIFFIYNTPCLRHS